jgi:hypothetical protein
VAIYKDEAVCQGVAVSARMVWRLWAGNPGVS